jgi:hypothetical protein
MYYIAPSTAEAAKHEGKLSKGISFLEDNVAVHKAAFMAQKL